MNRQTTLPERDDAPSAARPAGTALALVVAWCRDEPWRVGEALLVPPGAPGPTVRFGRGPSLAGEPTKSPLGQLRLGAWLPSPPLNGAAISRNQLALQALNRERLLIRNIGRCPLFVNETAVDSCELAPGDLARLGKQLLFLCALRTLEPSSDHDPRQDFPFGEPDPHGIVGESPAIWALRRQIARTAAVPGHVLVTGASGSGKELVAQAIHALSSRAARQIVARNAATLPESLIDAELFGNAKNYPNPGMPDRPGLIGEANGSTLFLDELAELPHSAQSHLLRVLDAGEYQRLGETRPRSSDFRLIAATNRDIACLKHDLRARFTFHIAVPALDTRKEDVPLLVRHLLRERPELGRASHDGVAPVEPSVPLDLVCNMLRHRFQTGVRELRSLLWKALIVPGDSAARGSVPEVASTAPPSPGASATDKPSQPTPEQVQKCLDENNGMIELAWRALGLSNRFALVRLIKRYDIEIRRRPRFGKRPSP